MFAEVRNGNDIRMLNEPQPGRDPGLGELFELLFATESLDSFLQDLAQLASERVDAHLSCGITADVDHHPITVAASDQFAAVLDEQQYDAGFGPCLKAMRTGEQIEITNLAHEIEQWGQYGPHALAHGLGACLATPLISTNRIWGALNLYSPEPESFTEADQTRSQDLAAQAAGAIAVASRLAEQTKLSEQLRTALNSRAVIDQAIGIIMAAQHCDADSAFATLRTASQNRNEKLRDIAVRIVQSTSQRSVPPS